MHANPLTRFAKRSRWQQNIPEWVQREGAFYCWRPTLQEDGSTRLDIHSPLPPFSNEARNRQAGTFEEAVFAAGHRQDGGIGILLSSAPGGLTCYRLKNAYLPDPGVFTNPLQLKAGMEISGHCEFSICGEHVNLWTRTESGPHPAALLGLGLSPVRGFVPLTGQEVPYNSVLRACEVALITVNDEDAEHGFGPPVDAPVGRYKGTGDELESLDCTADQLFQDSGYSELRGSTAWEPEVEHE